MLDWQCSPDVSLQDVGSGWISEPQRGPAVGGLIIPPARIARFAVLPRRLAPGCRLWRRLLAAPDSSRRLLTAPGGGSPGWLLTALDSDSSWRLSTAPGGSWRLSWLAPDGQIPAAPGGSGQVNHCAACISGISAQTSPSRMSALTVLPSPRETTQEGSESLRRLYF